MIASKVRMAMSSRFEGDREGEHKIGRGASRTNSQSAPPASEVLARYAGSGLLRHLHTRL